jgi:hypothetical protein
MIRLTACPQSKQIIGSKSWQGFSPFNFPGFVGTWNCGSHSGFVFTPGSGGVPSGWTEGWVGGTPATINVGDLVLSSIPPSDYESGTFPQIYYVYMCVLAGATASGRAVDPARDSSANGYAINSGNFLVTGSGSTEKHFAPWTGFLVAPYSPAQPDGPTPITVIDDETLDTVREVWTNGASAGVAYLNLSVTTEYDGWPSTGPTGYNTTEYPASVNYLNLTDGSFAYTWAVNQYTGAVTTGSPGTAPDTYQSWVLFPAVPNSWWTLGDTLIRSGIFQPGDQYPWSITCPLVSWNFTATELQFVWGAWLTGYDLGQEPSTITQTLVLSGEYDLSTSQSQALALLSGTTFAALNSQQKATCSYNSDGSISVATSALSATVSEDTTCSGGELAGPTATAAGGYAETAFSANGWSWTYAKALVDVCGQYCLRTFYCNRTPAVVDCASGSVDGYAPVEIDPPSFNASLGDETVYTFLFTNCQCS